MALNGKTTEEKIWNFLKAAGLSDSGTAALMGNLYAESALNPQNMQDSYESKLGYTDKTYTAAVDSGAYTGFIRDAAGYGIAQWTFWTRKKGLLEYARAAGRSVGDLEMQLEYLMKELKEDFPAVLSTLKTATAVFSASNVVLMKFEAPKDQSAAMQTKRAAYGQKYYDKYAGKKTETEGKHMISNCGHDENNKYSGGAAGDQTGGEWALIPWYSRPWNCVLRHPNAAVREKTAYMAEAAARNDCIGYDQNQRDTFGTELAKVGYDPAKIKTKCETDCSKGTIDIVKGVGHLLGNDKLKNLAATYTGNSRDGFRKAGYEVLTEAKYLNSPDYLLPGDILLNDLHHMAVNITKGSKAGTGSASGGSASGGTSSGTGTGGTAGKSEQTYTVKLGDTLSGIAAKYGTTYQKLAAYNGIANPDIINVGQVIRIPGSGVRTHTVESGDSLWSIAADKLGNGARYNEIKTMNGLETNLIKPGQILKLPEK